MDKFFKNEIELKEVRFKRVYFNKLLNNFPLLFMSGIFILTLLAHLFYPQYGFLIVADVMISLLTLYIVVLLLERYLEHNFILKITIFSLLVALTIFVVVFNLANDDIAYSRILSTITMSLLCLFILALLPFILVYVSEKILPSLFHLFFNYRFFKVKNNDFYTNEIDYLKEIDSKIQTDRHTDVFFLVITLVKEKDEKLKNIKEAFYKLIYFWYAYNYNRVFLRFLLPGFAIVISITAFISVFTLLTKIDFGDDYNNIVKMSYVVIFLTILYLSMLYHVNMFLNPLYYKKSIDKLFKKSKIKFQDINYSQKLILYLNKNFLFKIFDKKYDRNININQNREFEKFILEGEIDKEGRDNIVNVFVSIFMIIYLTIFAEALVDNNIDKCVTKQSPYELKIFKGNAR